MWEELQATTFAREGTFTETCDIRRPLTPAAGKGACAAVYYWPAALSHP